MQVSRLEFSVRQIGTFLTLCLIVIGSFQELKCWVRSCSCAGWLCKRNYAARNDAIDLPAWIL
jgi:hypothetical protein